MRGQNKTGLPYFQHRQRIPSTILKPMANKCSATAGEGIDSIAFLRVETDAARSKWPRWHAAVIDWWGREVNRSGAWRAY